MVFVTKVKDREVLSELTPSRMMMSADDCARAILRGVERNKGIIVVTAFARICWWLYRIHPALIKPLNQYWIRTGRALRSEQ